jgi:hypothetical protein
MPIMITVEQGAERIIDILVKEIGLKAGQEVPAQLLKEKYRAHDYDAGDLPAGIKYAVDQGLLELAGPKNELRLTELGQEYAS